MGTFINDTMTDVDGTSIVAHTGESGATWAVGAGTVLANIIANKLHYAGTTGGATTRWVASGLPGQSEYDIDCDITRDTSGVGLTGVMARGTTSTLASCYTARFNGPTGNWEILRTGGAGNATLATFTDPSFPAGTTKHMKFQVRDAGKTIYVDGVAVCTTTDNDAAMVLGGRLGIRMDGVGSATTGISLDNFVAQTPLPAPVNTVAPAITGTATVGQTVSCSTGTWTNSPSSFSYQWKRNGTVIGGATSSTYLLANPDIAQAITCTVTATNGTGSTATDSNTIVPADILPPPTNTVAPVATTLGFSTTGHVASATTGTWTNTPTSFTYQWTRDGSNIAGATTATHTLVSADEGHAIRCAVTATNATGSGTAVSHIINAEANHSVATQTDIVYQGTATGLTGTVFATIIKLDDATVVSARSSTAVIELAAGSGTYRCRRSLDAGKYIAQFDEGTYTPSTITPVPVSV